MHIDKSREYKLNKIHKYINENIKLTLDEFHETDILKQLETTVDNLYKQIEYLYEKNRILEAYYGSETNKYNGFLQKADVYSLGISIYGALHKYSSIDFKKNRSKLYVTNVANHMIDDSSAESSVESSAESSAESSVESSVSNNSIELDNLYDLLLHMIDIDPYKRYNIVQYLGHKYFTKKKKKKKRCLCGCSRHTTFK